MKLPRVVRHEVQPILGALPSLPHQGILLYELATNHNVLDFILYDMSGKIYYIQVSSTRYAKKDVLRQGNGQQNRSHS